MEEGSPLMFCVCSWNDAVTAVQLSSNNIWLCHLHHCFSLGLGSSQGPKSLTLSRCAVVRASDSLLHAVPSLPTSSYFLFPFSPLKFSHAGPFKSPIDGEPDLFSPTSPPATTLPSTPLDNGAASQPIRTPARNKKQKGHRR